MTGGSQSPSETTSRSTAARVGTWVLRAAAVAAVASIIAMLLTQQWDGAIRFVAVLVLIGLADRARVPLVFAGAFAVMALVSMWASVEQWYRAIDDFDLVIHFLTPGAVSAVVYFLVATWRIFPDVREQLPFRRFAPVAWTVSIGVTLAVVWEYYEWIVQQIAPASRIVGYTDTIGDLLAGMLGSATAGLLVVWWAGTHRRATAEDGR